MNGQARTLLEFARGFADRSGSTRYHPGGCQRKSHHDPLDLILFREVVERGEGHTLAGPLRSVGSGWAIEPVGSLTATPRVVPRGRFQGRAYPPVMVPIDYNLTFKSLAEYKPERRSDA